MSKQEEYKNMREQIAHLLTGSVCGQCKCSTHLGWSKPEFQPKCECYEIAGEIVALTESALASRDAALVGMRAKREQLREYIASIDPTTGESRRHALTIAEGRLLQIDMDIAALASGGLVDPDRLRREGAEAAADLADKLSDCSAAYIAERIRALYPDRETEQ